MDQVPGVLPERGLPVSQQGLCSFATTLAVEGLACATIKAYLAGVRHAQVERGWPDPHWGPKTGPGVEGHPEASG